MGDLLGPPPPASRMGDLLGPPPPERRGWARWVGGAPERPHGILGTFGHFGGGRISGPGLAGSVGPVGWRVFYSLAETLIAD